MYKIKKPMNTYILFFALFFLMACSDDNSGQSTTEGHVWKEQTETIDRAKEVEGEILNAAEATRKTIENQSQ